MAIYRIVEKEWEEDLRQKVCATQKKEPRKQHEHIVFSDVGDSASFTSDNTQMSKPLRPVSSSSSLTLLEDEYWTEEGCII